MKFGKKQQQIRTIYPKNPNFKAARPEFYFTSSYKKRLYIST